MSGPKDRLLQQLIGGSKTKFSRGVGCFAGVDKREIGRTPQRNISDDDRRIRTAARQRGGTDVDLWMPHRRVRQREIVSRISDRSSGNPTGHRMRDVNSDSLQRSRLLIVIKGVDRNNDVDV